VLPLGIVVSGLVYGSLAGLNSLGIVLLWRTTRLVNLAQPPLGLIGGVVTGLLVTASGWSFWWAAPFGILVGIAIGMAVDRLVFRKMTDAPRAAMLVATVGLAGVLGGIQTALPFALTGRSLPTYHISLGLTLTIHPVELSGPHILALIVFPIAVVGMLLFLYRTRFGLAALALGQDAERAQSLGVSASTVRSVVWVVAAVLATISGILSVPILGFNLEGNPGPVVLMLAIAPAVFAGFRSIVGAALASLSLGVVYQVVLFHSARAGYGLLVFAVGILIAVTLQRQRLGRAESAVRASSWEAAATVRPLPMWVRSSLSWRFLVRGFALVALVGVMLPPVFLARNHQVAYGVAAALALATLGVAVAWMFTGEIALGHWGFAGFGGAVAAIAPGPWPVRCVAAGIVVSCAGALLAIASRRQSTLSFAVLGLAVAAAAPVAVEVLSGHTLPADPAPVGAFTAGFAVLAAIAVTKLRGTVTGARMVAARDDPSRAVWLGAHLMRERVIALAISSGLAGMAGALLLSATPGGFSPGVFDPQISLDLLLMAVIGGLGSPAGALLGAAIFQFGRHVLPDSWQLLLSGTGVLLIVIFRPAGLSRLTTWIRDLAVRAFVRAPRETAVEEAAA
jgi:branched-chain amino acid transport system permease protein